MRSEGVEVESIRFADQQIPVGVQPDMTEAGEDADEWPLIFEKVKAADIIVIGTPLWLKFRF